MTKYLAADLDTHGTGPGSLSDLMDFDHVIVVHDDGTVTDHEYGGPYAPSVYDESPDSNDWELLNGFSGQYSYHGPILHESEYIGGGLADYILSTPGTYVAVSVYGMDHDCPFPEDCEDDMVGWAVARLKVDNSVESG